MPDSPPDITTRLKELLLKAGMDPAQVEQIFRLAPADIATQIINSLPDNLGPDLVARLPDDLSYTASTHAFSPAASRFGETALQAFIALAGEGSGFPEPYHETVLRDVYGNNPASSEHVLALVRIGQTLESPVTEQMLQAEVDKIPDAAERVQLTAAIAILHDAAQNDIGAQADHPFDEALRIAGDFFSPQLSAELWQKLDAKVEVNDPFAIQYDGTAVMIDRTEDRATLDEKISSDPEGIIAPVDAGDIDQAYKVLENGGTVLLQALDVRPYVNPAVQAGVGMPEAIAALTGDAHDVIATPEEYAARLESGDFAGKTFHFISVKNEDGQSIAAGFQEIVLSNMAIAQAMTTTDPETGKNVWPTPFPQTFDGMTTDGPEASKQISDQIVALLVARDADGNPVMGSDGKPLLRPDAAELAQHIELGGYSMGGLRATLALDMAWDKFSCDTPEAEKREVFSNFTVFTFGGAMLVNPEAPYKVVNTLNHDGEQHYDLVIDKICAIQRELLPQGDNYLELHAPFKDPDLQGHSILGLYDAITAQASDRQFARQVNDFVQGDTKNGDPVAPNTPFFSPDIQNALDAVGNIFA
ncbi:MAG: hypothetical protein IT567_02075, partial [Alphaproteobacteria bacterium]|nr:hypothetical protein [Alphaproteobacteria bacterium]